MRRLLESYLEQARRHGITGHRVNTWVRRKLGSRIAVWRLKADGSLGCAIPCLLCQRELVRFDLTVFYTEAGGSWARGRPSHELEALGGGLTSGQRRQWNNWQPVLQKTVSSAVVPQPAACPRLPVRRRHGP